MPLIPKRVKHRKQMRGSRAGNAGRGTALSFGAYGLQALERGWITNTQIEACRVAINRNMKRKGKLWIRVFPDKPVSKKPAETRMGKGKANTEYWVAVIRPGRMLFEVDGLPETIARESIRLAANKLPIRTRFITRERKLVA
jgi:large subunit ribosomal protein L16